MRTRKCIPQYALNVWGFLFGLLLIYSDSIGQHKGSESKSSPYLADLSGNPYFRHKSIGNRSEWEQAKSAIRDDLQKHVYGSFPHTKPAWKPQLISSSIENQVVLQTWEIRFGPEFKGKVRIETMIPTDSTTAKPVLMTQFNHRGWAILAVQRGYVGCIYTANDDWDESRNLSELYPEARFGTLAKRAWLASRVVDFLHTRKWADTNKIAITGHSRNGKQSILAAAFDPRIDALVSSSAGTGGELPFRYSNPFFNNESIEQITRKFPDWFCPDLKSYAGREWELPVDQHLLIGLIAPRPVLISTATHEAQASTVGTESLLRSLKTIYKWYSKPDNVSVWYREGEHGTDAGVIETYLDWLDQVFRKKAFDLPQYQGLDYLKDVLSLDNNTTVGSDSLLHALLGKAPPSVTNNRYHDLSKLANKDHFQTAFMTQALSPKAQLVHFPIGPYNELGEYLFGNLYLPETTTLSPTDTVRKKYPVVVYLHGASWNSGFRKDAEIMIKAMTSKGFAVLCFDQIGFGIRQAEAGQFYKRFPDWTLLGKMVHDARTVIEMVSHMNFADNKRIHILGSGIGSLVALLACEGKSPAKSLVLIDPFFRFLGNDPDMGHWLHKEAGLTFPNGLNRKRLDQMIETNLRVEAVFVPGGDPFVETSGLRKRNAFEWHQLPALFRMVSETIR